MMTIWWCNNLMTVTCLGVCCSETQGWHGDIILWWNEYIMMMIWWFNESLKFYLFRSMLQWNPGGKLHFEQNWRWPSKPVVPYIMMLLRMTEMQKLKLTFTTSCYIYFEVDDDDGDAKSDINSTKQNEQELALKCVNYVIILLSTE